MLDTLLASQARRTRSASAQFLSLMVHGTLIGGAVFATQRAAAIIDPVDAVPTVWVSTPERVEPQPTTPVIATPPLGFPIVSPVLDIPNALPDIDLTRSITDPRDYLDTRGVPGGNRHGTGPAITGIMTAEQVDRAAALLPGNGRPAYPDGLRSAGLSGEVLVQFVVDSLGRAEMTNLTVVSSTHERFTDAVRKALAKARFAPAEFDGRRVPQLVRMPFVFSLQRN